MEPVIDRPDLVTDAAFKAPLDLKKNFVELGNEVDLFIEVMLHEQQVVGDTSSVDSLTKSMHKLLEEQKKLTDVQKKLEKEVHDLKEENKRLNQEQKRLEDQLEKTNRKVKQQDDAMEALDNRTGGLINRYKALGKELLAIMKSPIVLFLAALTAAVYAAVESVKAYFTAVGEGEDVAARQKAVWDQFWHFLEKGWINLGRTIFGAINEERLENILYKLIRIFVGVKEAADFRQLAKQAKELADVLDSLQERQMAQDLKAAGIRSTIDKLQFQSTQKALYSDEQRLAFLEEAVRLSQTLKDQEIAFAKEQAQATLIEIGLRHDLTKVETLAMTQEERFALFKAEENQKIYDALTKIKTLEGERYSEIRKNEIKIQALREEIRKDQIAKLTKDLEAQVRAEDDKLEARIQAIRNEVLMGNKIKKDGDKEIADLRRVNAANLIQNQINSLKQLLGFEKLNAEERAAIELKLHDLKIKLNEAEYDAFTELQETEVEAGMSKIESLRNIYMSFADSVGQVFQSFTDNRLAQIDAEERALEESYDRQIEMAGNNTKKKSKLENEFAKKQRELELQRVKEQRRIAIFEKTVTFIQAGANAALAATNQAAKGDPYSAFARVAAILAALAPLVASIASKDIPAFKEGGTTTTKVVRVSEEGSEMYKTPAGEVGFTPAEESFATFPIGTKITAHKPSMRMVAEAALKTQERSDRRVGHYEVLLNKFIESNKNLERVVKNKKETHINITKKGLEKAFVSGATKTYFLNNMYP